MLLFAVSSALGALIVLGISDINEEDYKYEPLPTITLDDDDDGKAKKD